MSSGDVNGDGYADVLIGAYLADPGGGSDAGETYVVYNSAESVVTKPVGPAGETVAIGSDSLIIPAGALSDMVMIGMAEITGASGRFPASDSLTGIGAAYHMTPDGQTLHCL